LGLERSPSQQPRPGTVDPTQNGHEDTPMDSTTMNATSTNHSTAPPSYFNQPGYSLLLWGHILLSIAAWVFILPVGKSAGHKAFG